MQAFLIIINLILSHDVALFGMHFSGFFCRKITVTIWYMWGEKAIGKYVYKKYSNFAVQTRLSKILINNHFSKLKFYV